jgi:uncharacterized protein YecT (DUF1311 family)
MPRRISLPIAVLAAVAGVCLAVAAPGGAARGQGAALAPPVIHESFTLLPCTGAPATRTTLELEGCAEHRIVADDVQINALSRQIFAALFDGAARGRYVAAARAWLAYRQADCQSMSDVYEGGTLAAVVDAQCQAARDDQRVKDLRAFHANLTSTGG